MCMMPHLALAEPDRDLIGKRDRGPGEAGNAFDRAKQAREAADLGIHVGLAALGDQAAGAGRRQDFGTGIRGRTKHAHGVIMREQDIFDRLVGDLFHAVDDLPRHHRRGLRIDHHHAVVADNDPGIGIALGGEGVEVRPNRVEGDGLVGQIGGRGETRTHGICSRSALTERVQIT